MEEGKEKEEQEGRRLKEEEWKMERKRREESKKVDEGMEEGK